MQEIKSNSPLSWLWNSLDKGSILGLERIKYLLNLLGNPQLNYKSIHITGTSGKGSTSVMVASILNQDGFKVGLFTSPYLINPLENISVNGQIISNEVFEEYALKIKPYLDLMNQDRSISQPTYYEIITAMMYLYFSDQKIDFAVIEAWMGGQFDATNVICPLVSIITNVSIEHSRFLGETVEAIAINKAGIVKQKGILVTANENPAVDKIFKEVTQKQQAQYIRIGIDSTHTLLHKSPANQTISYQGLQVSIPSITIPFIGDHQAKNAVTAITAIEMLRDFEYNISSESIIKGLDSELPKSI